MVIQKSNIILILLQSVGTVRSIRRSPDLACMPDLERHAIILLFLNKNIMNLIQSANV